MMTILKTYDIRIGILIARQLRCYSVDTCTSHTLRNRHAGPEWGGKHEKNNNNVIIIN